jgi:hypothetical protein
MLWPSIRNGISIQVKQTMAATATRALLIRNLRLISGNRNFRSRLMSLLIYGKLPGVNEKYANRRLVEDG